jgi:hypothetical protein
VTGERHAELRAALSDIHPEGFTRLEEFESSFERLLELRQQTHDFDAGRLRALLFGELGLESRSKVHSWAAHLGRSYARDSEESRSTGRPFREILYRRLFAMEEVLCEDCTENLEYRRRGTTRLPLEQLAGRQYAFDQLVAGLASRDTYSQFLPTTMEKYLLAGTYRLQVWTDADALECESVFFVGGDWEPEIIVDLVRPQEDLWREAVPFELGTRALPLDGKPLLVPAFRLVPRLVTNAEVLTFERSGGHVECFLNRSDARPDTPAFVDLRTAQSYVQRSGGRLPFLAEILRASEEGLLELAPDGDCAGEYVLDVHPQAATAHHWLDYGLLMNSAFPSLLSLVPDEHLATSAMRFLEASSANSRGVAFRVVFSADRPDTYRELSRSPFDELGLEPVGVASPAQR